MRHNSPIKLVILDVDGVLTNGTKAYGLDGSVLFKHFADRDFTAIKEMKASGFIVVFLSGDEQVNKKIAASRNIPFYSSRLSSSKLGKEKAVLKILENYDMKLAETLFVGDDLFDAALASKVGFSACPSDSHRSMKDSCTWTLQKTSGDHCIQALVDLLIQEGLMQEPTVESVVELDASEAVSYSEK